MLRQSVQRVSMRALRPAVPARSRTRAGVMAPASSALIHTDQNQKKDGTGGGGPGGFARTDKSIKVEYPEEHELPSSSPVQGRGGMHLKRTLASFSLEGKVGVVTGLGLIFAQGQVISGSSVAIVDMNKEEADKQAAELVDLFRSENPGATGVPKVTAHYADVADEESVRACLEDIIQVHGKIDNLVTSAGFTENIQATDYSIERVRKLWGVNVDGTYLFATNIAKHLMERRVPGSMVFIGSMSGAIVNVPQPQTPYNASKAAVRHMAASLAVEWAHAGIRVNCLAPGYMLTALTEKILDEKPDLKRRWISLIPQGRMGQPVDLMGPCTFLLSDAAAYVTGAELRVDGGYTVT